MTDSALVLHESTALSAYAEREDVRELGDRLMAMHPAASEVGPAAMRAAAQLAILLGANPLPGVNEVHIWKDNKGRSCMSLGINYWRRKSQEWGGVLYQTEPRPMTPQEATLYNIPQGVTGAICKGARAADVIKYRQLGFSAAEIWSMCGRVGLGTQQQNEYAKQGRPSVWTAMKRAETDMLRQLFPAEFGNIDRQTLAANATPVAIGDVIETADAETGQGNELYTVDDLNGDLFDEPEVGKFELVETPQPAKPLQNGNGKPADPQPTRLEQLKYTELFPAETEFEARIYNSSAGEFLDETATVLNIGTTAVKTLLNECGWTKIPGNPNERLKAFRDVRDAFEAKRAAQAEAQQPELVAVADVSNGAYSD